VRKQFAWRKRRPEEAAWLPAVLRTRAEWRHNAVLFAGMLITSCVVAGAHGVVDGKTFSAPAREAETAVAREFAGQTDAEGFALDAAWESAPAIRFCSDWQGKNADPERETEVRLLWSRDALRLRFVARFRDISAFADAEPNGRRDQLWERDVAEVFLQPSGPSGMGYKEFEVSPNGFWIDLDIAPGKKRDLESRLKRRTSIDEKRKIWRAELILPMKSLTENFDPAKSWRLNFFRVEGPSEPRFYSAWQPTGTPVPNFHVPDAFGKLVFEK
jgi:alpha-galactosidase